MHCVYLLALYISSRTQRRPCPYRHLKRSQNLYNGHVVSNPGFRMHNVKRPSACFSCSLLYRFVTANFTCLGRGQRGSYQRLSRTKDPWSLIVDACPTPSVLIRVMLAPEVTDVNRCGENGRTDWRKKVTTELKKKEKKWQHTCTGLVSSQAPGYEHTEGRKWQRNERTKNHNTPVQD